MGKLFRQYWLPALLSSELPAPDCNPVRVLLLGERLIAFRDTSGRVGLIQNHCPHRGASLFYGRNEAGGLRCVYHGWKFDVAGRCLDMPNEPPESDFKHKLKARAYPCAERGGIVWAYLGPRATPPPLPDLEANQLPPARARVSAFIRDCNWLQALEGDIDTSHFSFLHLGSVTPEEVTPGSFLEYTLRDRAPRYAVVDTEYGCMYGAWRPATPGHRYWRIAQFLFPCFTHIPTGVLGKKVETRAWVPMDDHHTLFFSMEEDRSQDPNREKTLVQEGYVMSRKMDNRDGPPLLPALPNTSDWLGRFRTAAHTDNDYGLNRERQRTTDYSGIFGIHTQDQAMTESMGPIYDRTSEHLGSSDVMVIRVRRRLLGAVRHLVEEGTTPPGVDEPWVYRTRSGGVILPEDADWLQATEAQRAGQT
ncbi:MAG: Rieske 2Fe-2S domain-containing protein [Firmicutes bacterium]|nr:Rieske 2Fe-2S domain-containing protein [Alicyclobacillaceae bacterium]MCL6498136.1 Rieske 2Fe-2S domain-containing protein [Bacillota bacterium]